jgi:hypothetical protein
LASDARRIDATVIFLDRPDRKLSISMTDDIDGSILALVEARLAAIEAAVPLHLTKVAAGESPLGLEAPVKTSMQVDGVRGRRSSKRRRAMPAKCWQAMPANQLLLSITSRRAERQAKTGILTTTAFS